MKTIKKLTQGLVILSSLVIFGCSSSDKSPPTPSDPPLSGTFTTPVVKGLGYKTATQSGQTDASGTFKYKEGEVIEFYIGDIFVGETDAKAIITPLDLEQTAPSKKTASSRASNLNDNWAINLFNLLLSLDSDGDISTGIEITAEVTTKAASISLDLTLPPADFIADTSTSNFASSVSVTLQVPADISIAIQTNYASNSNWGTMVWGTSNWGN